MSAFDRRFGPDFLSQVPLRPGVYRFLDSVGQTVYVGKAKVLRRRLSQYRAATSAKKHRRMRRVVKAATSLVWQELPNHIEACLLEVRLIQELRPALNISSAFSHRYPYLGIGVVNSMVTLAFTARLPAAALAGTNEPVLPNELLGMRWYGAFRSRELTLEAFWSLGRLFQLIGHGQKLPKAQQRQRGRPILQAFRQIPPAWVPLWGDFLAGKSGAVLTELCLELLERRAARNRAAEVEEDLGSLKLFWAGEALVLAKALERTQYCGDYPIPQRERDLLFIRDRLRGELNGAD